MLVWKERLRRSIFQDASAQGFGISDCVLNAVLRIMGYLNNFDGFVWDIRFILGGGDWRPMVAELNRKHWLPGLMLRGGGLAPRLRLLKAWGGAWGIIIKKSLYYK